MADFIAFFRLFDFFDLQGGSKWSFSLNFFRFKFSTRGRISMVNSIDFFRQFDFSTRLGGSKWSILMNYYDFST